MCFVSDRKIARNINMQDHKSSREAMYQRPLTYRYIIPVPVDSNSSAREAQLTDPDVSGEAARR